MDLKTWCAGVAIVLGLGASMAVAQEASPVALIEALSPEKTGPTVRALSSQNALAFLPDQPLPEGYDFPLVGVSVEFQDDTHILTMRGMRSLRTVAVALKDPSMQGHSFQVAAHVFSEKLGSAQFPLSTRRARAVVQHLTVYYGVPQEMLFAVGYGATRPVDRAQPYSARNTRVELINVSQH